MEKEKFRVIEIVNEKKIIINYGKRHGADVGDKIQIYVPGRKVVDPISHQDLGTWDYVKDSLTIVETFDLFSICSKTITKNILSGIGDITTTTIEPLFVDKDQMTNQNASGDMTIKVGDLVRKI